MTVLYIDINWVHEWEDCMKYIVIWFLLKSCVEDNSCQYKYWLIFLVISQANFHFRSHHWFTMGHWFCSQYSIEALRYSLLAYFHCRPIVKMQLFVQSLELHTFEVTGDETVRQMKEEISAREGLTADDLAIYAAGRPLEDDATLSACAGDLATLHVDVRMLGGQCLCSVKLPSLICSAWATLCSWVISDCHVCQFFCPSLGKVHGSLARAGKVKGQTPKVGLNIRLSCFTEFCHSVLLMKWRGLWCTISDSYHIQSNRSTLVDISAPQPHSFPPQPI